MSGGFMLEQPLVIQGKQEEAPGIFGNAVPLRFMPSFKNYATDQKTVEYFKNEIAPVMDFTRQDRQSLEEEWATIRNMNLMQHDSGRRYFGRSDSYLPTYRRERQKIVAHWSRGLFPSDEYFDVVDLGSGDPEKARPVKQYMKWELDTNARVRSHIKPFLGSLADYGNGIKKYWYKKEVRTMGGVTRKQALGNLIQNEYGFKPYSCEGLAVSTRNLFYWYIYPATAESLNDAMMIFEDIDVPVSFVEWMVKMGRWKVGDYNPLDHGDTNIISEHSYNMQRLLDTRAQMQQPGRGMSSTRMGRQITATEGYTFMPLPDDSYMAHEKRGYPVPVQVTCLGDQPVEIRRNPFYHQRHPYLASRIDWEPGFFYGTGQGRIIRPLQLLSNDFMNQTNDNGILAMNPVSIIDVTKMAGLPPPFKPGATWYTLDIDAVKFDRPPLDSTHLGLLLTQTINGMAQDAGGAPPDFSTKGGAASKTATGMSIAQRNTAGPVQDVVEDIEIDVFVELLKNGWKNAVQYRDQAVMISVAGERIEVSPDMLAIDADFRMLGSSQAANQQVRTQQALQLIQMITPIVPLIIQTGYVVDFVGVIKRVWTDGFGYRNFSEFIRRAQAVPGPGLPAGDQMGGVQAEQGDRLRSALEQVHGQGDPLAEAQPGETDDFTAVRQNADQLAGMTGGYH